MHVIHLSWRNFISYFSLSSDWYLLQYWVLTQSFWVFDDTSSSPNTRISVNSTAVTEEWWQICTSDIIAMLSFNLHLHFKLFGSWNWYYYLILQSPTQGVRRGWREQVIAIWIFLVHPYFSYLCNLPSLADL